MLEMFKSWQTFYLRTFDARRDKSEMNGLPLIKILVISS